MIIRKIKKVAIAIWGYVLSMLASFFAVDKEEEEEQYKDYRYL